MSMTEPDTNCVTPTEPTDPTSIERSPVFDSDRVQTLLTKAGGDAPLLESYLEEMKSDVKDEIVETLLDAVYNGDIPEGDMGSVIDVLCKIEQKKFKELKKLKALLEDMNFDGFYDQLAVRRPDRKESDQEAAATDAASVAFNISPHKVRAVKALSKDFNNDQERLLQRLDRLSPKQALENKSTLELQRDKHTKESANRLEASKTSTGKTSESVLDKKMAKAPMQTLAQLRQQEVKAIADQLVITTNPQQQQALLRQLGRMGPTQRAMAPLIQAQINNCQMQVDVAGLGLNRRSAVVERWREQNSQNNPNLIQTIDAITHYSSQHAHAQGPPTDAQEQAPAAPSPFKNRP